MLKVNVKHYRVPITMANQCNKRGPTNILTARLYNRHMGKFSVMLEQDDTPNIRGGVTVCEIVEVTNKGKERVVAKGIAYCSMQDAYSYYAGRRLAIDRALGLRKQPNVKSWKQPVTKPVVNKVAKKVSVVDALDAMTKPTRRKRKLSVHPDTMLQEEYVLDDGDLLIMDTEDKGA